MSSLDKSSRIKVLSHLARTPDKVAIAPLEREAKKIVRVLEHDRRFEVLREQLELFDVFAFRVPDMAVNASSRFLLRLESLDIVPNQDSEWIGQYETSARLAVATLDLLSRIRYFQTKQILEIFMRCAASNEEDVRKKALECLQRIAELDIDVFYSGENRAGLGARPQIDVVEWLEALDRAPQSHQLGAVVALCGNLLAPNMSGTSWNYRSVTWKSGAVPAMPEIIDVRRRVLRLLREMYADAFDVAVKGSIINAMLQATWLPSHRGYGDDVVQMVSANTVDVFEFLEGRLSEETFQIVQKIEHDAFWRFYHAPTEAVKIAALRIRDRLDTLKEYSVYRDLVGFEGIFERWEDRKETSSDFKAIKAYRSNKAHEYARGIEDDTWDQWRARIIAFGKTESNDLATFPHFFEFLRLFAEHRPDLALRLLREDLAQIRPFTIPLLRGVWNGPERADLQQLMLEWIRDGQELGAVSKLFWSNSEVDEAILQILFESYVGEQHRVGLGLLIYAAISNYKTNPSLVNKFALPSIKALSVLGDASWVNEIWYRPETPHIFAELDAVDREIVLEGLLHLKEIDYHAEVILFPLAERDPRRIVQFFGQRLVYSKAPHRERPYDAIPFSFHNLHKVLERSPSLVIGVVKKWFDGDELDFQYGGGRLLKIVFPEFPKPFSDELSQLVETRTEQNLAFVLAILRNYDGEPFLYNICKDIVAVMPDDAGDLLTEVHVILLATGVVVGEFGFAEAYEQKIEAIRPWLDDQRAKVRNFARLFIESLEQMAQDQRRRAQESIELRKHEYGVSDDDIEPTRLDEE